MKDLLRIAAAAPALVASLSAQTLAQDAPNLPEPWVEAAVYYNGFNNEDASADIGLPSEAMGSGALRKHLVEDGLIGGAYTTRVGEAQSAVELRNRELIFADTGTISFWWTPEREMEAEDGLGLLRILGAERSVISVMIRGRGKWRALEKPGGFLTVSRVPGVQDIAPTWSRDLLSEYDLTPGLWHHTALVLSAGGQTLDLYIDGDRAYNVTLVGSGIGAEQAMERFQFGSRFDAEAPMRVDELFIADRAFDAEAIRSYVQSIRAMTRKP